MNSICGVSLRFFSVPVILVCESRKREFIEVALSVTQRSPEECLFIDDRELNLECARQLRFRTIHFQDAAQLRRDLIASGVSI